ncbi:RNA-binding protein [Feifania hominis]|uniref:RNA-binding S4 domain-containing protein n=1 Tax=Feifania hominis TaxID=2763660 RepID=A0A926DC79_9FIRM|nr:YlmH/Sll1252 family protein [Feifania hominis]MBC8535423.1 hypothetical protein [Feifania hominis]
MGRVGVDGEQRLLLRRAEELVERAERSGRAVSRHFYTPAEQELIAGAFRGRTPLTLEFDGGYEGAERRMLLLYEQGEIRPEPPLTAVAIEFPARAAVPAHRDYLGSLMGLNLKRETIGDILACPQSPGIVFAADAVCGVLYEELREIGRTPVTARPARLEEIVVPEPDGILKRATVASLRLDSVAAEGFGLSRTRMAALIAAGGLQLNFRPCESPSREVGEGDVFSVRGRGRVVLTHVGGNSKKGRTFVELTCFLR